MESLKMVDGSLSKHIPEQFGFAFISCDIGSCAVTWKRHFQPKGDQGDLSSSFLNRLQKAGYIACSNSGILLTKGGENMKCQS